MRRHTSTKGQRRESPSQNARPLVVTIQHLAGLNIIAGGAENYLYVTVRIGGHVFTTPFASQPASASKESVSSLPPPSSPTALGTEGTLEGAAAAAAATTAAGPSPLSGGFDVQFPSPQWPFLAESKNRILFFCDSATSAMPDAEFIVKGRPRALVEEQRRALQAKNDAISRLLESSSSSNSSSDDDDDDSDDDCRSRDTHSDADAEDARRRASPPRRQSVSDGRRRAQRRHTTAPSASSPPLARSDPLATQAVVPSPNDRFIGYARVRLDGSMLQRPTAVRLGIRGPADEPLLRLLGTLGSLQFTLAASGEDALDAVGLKDSQRSSESDDADEHTTLSAYLAAEHKAVEEAPSFDRTPAVSATALAPPSCTLCTAAFCPLDPVFTTAALAKYDARTAARAWARLERRRAKLQQLERLDRGAQEEWWHRRRAKEAVRRPAEPTLATSVDPESVEALVRGCGGALRRLLTVEGTALSLQLHSQAPVDPTQSATATRKTWPTSEFAFCPPERGADPTQRTLFREQLQCRREYLAAVLRSGATGDPSPVLPPTWSDRFSASASRTPQFRWGRLHAVMDEDDLLRFAATVALSTMPSPTAHGLLAVSDSGASPATASCQGRPEAEERREESEEGQRLRAYPVEVLCRAEGPLCLREATDECGVRSLEAVVPCYTLHEAAGAASSLSRLSRVRHGCTGTSPRGISRALGASNAPEGPERREEEEEGEEEKERDHTVLENTASQFLSATHPFCGGTASTENARAASNTAEVEEGDDEAGMDAEDDMRANVEQRSSIMSGNQRERCSLPGSVRETECDLPPASLEHSATARPRDSPAQQLRHVPRWGDKEECGEEMSVQTTARCGTPCGWLCLSFRGANGFDPRRYAARARASSHALRADGQGIGARAAPRAVSVPNVPNRVDAPSSDYRTDRHDSLGSFAGCSPAAATRARSLMGEAFKGALIALPADLAEEGLPPAELANPPPGGFVVSPVQVTDGRGGDGGGRRRDGGAPPARVRYVVVGVRSGAAPSARAGPGGPSKSEVELFTSAAALAVDGVAAVPACVYRVEACGPALTALLFDVFELAGAGVSSGVDSGSDENFTGARARHVGRCRWDFTQLPFVGSGGFALRPCGGQDGSSSARGAAATVADGACAELLLRWNISPEAQQAAVLQQLERTQEHLAMPSVVAANDMDAPAGKRSGDEDSDSSAADSGGGGGGGFTPRPPRRLNANSTTLPPTQALPAELPRAPRRPLSPLPPPPSAPRSFSSVPPPPAGIGTSAGSPLGLAPPRRKDPAPAQRAPQSQPGASPPLTLSGRTSDVTGSGGSNTVQEPCVRVAENGSHGAAAHSAARPLRLRVTVLAAMNLRLPRPSALGGGEGGSAVLSSAVVAPYVVVCYHSESRDNYGPHLPLVRVQTAGESAAAAAASGGSGGADGAGTVVCNFCVALTVPPALSEQPFQLLTLEMRDANTRALLGAGTLSVPTPLAGASVATPGVNKDSRGACAQERTQSHMVPLYRRADLSTSQTTAGEAAAVVAMAARQLLRTGDGEAHDVADGPGASRWLLDAAAPCVGELMVLTSIGPDRSLAEELLSVTDEQDASSLSPRATLHLTVLGGTDLCSAALPQSSVAPYVVVRTQPRGGRERQYRSGTAPTTAGAQPLWYLELPPLPCLSADDALTFTVLHADADGFDAVLGEATLTVRALLERANADGSRLREGTSGANDDGIAARARAVPPQLLRLPLARAVATIGQTMVADGLAGSAGFLTVEWFMQKSLGDDAGAGAGADDAPHVLALQLEQALHVALPRLEESDDRGCTCEPADVLATVLGEYFADDVGKTAWAVAPFASDPRRTDRRSGEASPSSSAVLIGQLRASSRLPGGVDVAFFPDETIALRLSSRVEPVKIELYVRTPSTRESSARGSRPAAGSRVELDERADQELSTPSLLASRSPSDGHGASLHFLGEATLHTAALLLSSAAQEPQPVTVSLRPRRDPRYRTRDVLRANGVGNGGHGLGLLTLRAALYTLPTHDARVRRVRQLAGHGYTVQLQVADSADFAVGAVYIVEVRAMGTGETHRTRPAAGLHPDFQRQSVWLSLHNPTELVEVRLLRCLPLPLPSRDGKRTATESFDLVGSAIVTLVQPNGPAENDEDRDGLEGQSSVHAVWLTLLPPTGGASAHQPGGTGVAPKLFIRWRTAAAGATLRRATPVPVPSLPLSPLPRPHYLLPWHATRGALAEEAPGLHDAAAVRGNGSPRSRVEVLSSLTSRSVSPQLSPARLSAFSSPLLAARQAAVRTRNDDAGPGLTADPLTLRVLDSRTGQLMHYAGAAHSTAADVIAYCEAVAEHCDAPADTSSFRAALSSRDATRTVRMALFLPVPEGGSARTAGAGEDCARNSSCEEHALPLHQPLSHWLSPGSYVLMRSLNSTANTPGPLPPRSPGGVLQRAGAAGAVDGHAACDGAVAVKRDSHTTPNGDCPRYYPATSRSLAAGRNGELPLCRDFLWLHSPADVWRTNATVLQALAQRAIADMTDAGDEAEGEEDPFGPVAPSCAEPRDAPAAAPAQTRGLCTCSLTVLCATIDSPELQILLPQVRGRVNRLRGFCGPCKAQLPAPSALRIALHRTDAAQYEELSSVRVQTVTDAAVGSVRSGASSRVCPSDRAPSLVDHAEYPPSPPPTRTVDAFEFVVQGSAARVYALLRDIKDSRGRPLLAGPSSAQEDNARGEPSAQGYAGPAGLVAVAELVEGCVPWRERSSGVPAEERRGQPDAPFFVAMTAEEDAQCWQRYLP